jgi:hypothetical protein
MFFYKIIGLGRCGHIRAKGKFAHLSSCKLAFPPDQVAKADQPGNVYSVNESIQIHDRPDHEPFSYVFIQLYFCFIIIDYNATCPYLHPPHLPHQHPHLGRRVYAP